MRDLKKSITIVLADDDPEDRLLLSQALAEVEPHSDLHCVGNGEELLDYLWGRGPYSDRTSAPPPSLILLDLNMPKKNGWEALQEIRADPALAHVPVILLTTSRMQEDIARSYALGANSFITKPATFAGLVTLMQTLSKYWLETVQLPDRE